MQDYEFLLTLSKKDIVVCNNSFIKTIEEVFCSNKSQFINFTILNYNDFIQKALGTIDDQCLIELQKKGFNPFYAKRLMDNYLLYKQLNMKDNRYEEVEEILRHFFIIDEIIIEKIKSTPHIYYINPDLTNNMVNLTLKKYPNITIKNVYPHKVENIYLTEAKNIETEVYNLSNNLVKEYMEDKTEEFSIVVPDDSYLPYIYRNFDMYKIEYTSHFNNHLYDLDYVKDLIDYLDQNNSYQISLLNTYLENLIPTEEINQLIQVLNEFIKYDPSDYPFFRELLIEKLKNTEIKKDTKTNIHIYKQLPEDQKGIIFILGFNQNIIIKSITDDDFISDNQKVLYNMPVANLKNQFQNELFINLLLTYKKVYLSYNTDNEKILSLLFEEINQKHHIEMQKINEENLSSPTFSQYQATKYFDTYEIYQEIDPELKKIYEQKYLEDYQSYDNQFNGHFTIDDPITLSYTSLDAFYHCSYQYYLKNILRIKDNQDQSNILVGNYFHNLIKDFSTNEKDIKDISVYTHKYMEENQIKPTKQNQYYYERYQNYLIKAYKYIEDFQERSSFNDCYYEKEFLKKLGTDTVKGIIDKVLIQRKDNQSNIVIIDYKTGSTIIDLPLIEYGLSMQLPFYFYLIADEGNNEIIGGYIQRVLPSKIYEKDDKKTFEDNFFDEYRYNGLSTSNMEKLPIIDSKYQNEKSIISGLKVNSDGSLNKNFLKRTFNEEEVKQIIAFVKQKILEALNKIHQGIFSINPKMVGDINTCDNCKFSSICNKRYQNYQLVKKDEELTFLRGKKDDTK